MSETSGLGTPASILAAYAAQADHENQLALIARQKELLEKQAREMEELRRAHAAAIQEERVRRLAATSPTHTSSLTSVQPPEYVQHRSAHTSRVPTASARPPSASKPLREASGNTRTGHYATPTASSSLPFPSPAQSRTRPSSAARTAGRTPTATPSASASASSASRRSFRGGAPDRGMLPNAAAAAAAAFSAPSVPVIALVLNIPTDAGDLELHISSDQDPAAVAHAFCTKNGLGSEDEEALASTLKVSPA